MAAARRLAIDLWRLAPVGLPLKNLICNSTIQRLKNRPPKSVLRKNALPSAHVLSLQLQITSSACSKVRLTPVFPFLVFYPLAVASVSSSVFVCADSAGIRTRRASSESRK